MILAQITSATDALSKIENIVPPKYRTLLILGAIAVPYAGRAWHALANGGGLMGVYRALLFGTNVPKPSSFVKSTTEDRPTNNQNNTNEVTKTV